LGAEVALLCVRVIAGGIAGLGMVLIAEQASAGAWTLERGRGELVATATASSASRVFDGAQSLGSAPRYNKFEFETLFEYGVTDWFTAIVGPGLQHVDIAAPVHAHRTGFGYSDFGGRLRIFNRDNWVLSGQATVRVPGTFDAVNPAAIGYNGFEYDFRLLLGHGFKVAGRPAFVDVQLAQRFRSGDPPNELRVDATFGLLAAPRWLLLTQVFNVISQGASPPIYPSYDYSKFQLAVAYAVTRQWWLQAAGFTTFHGRNALQENGLQLGSWYRF
jgi:hypothetical protein